MRGICRTDVLLSYDNEETKALLFKLADVSRELDEILNTIDYYGLNNGKRIPFVYEKVNYYISKCNNSIILDKLNVLYKEYCGIRNKIFELNSDLINVITHEYCEDFKFYSDDIIQCSNVCFMKAIERYDVNNNESFSIYSYSFVYRMLIRELGSLLYSVKVPQRFIEYYYRIVKCYFKISQTLGRSATIVELAAYMNMSVKEVGEIISNVSNVSSLDESKVLIEENDLVLDGKSDEFLECLQKLLTEKQFLVLVKLYGLDGKVYNPVELANELGISRQQVNSHKIRALARLRKNKNLILDVIKD